MHVRTGIASTVDAACVPKGPSCGVGSARDAGCGCLEEVELVGWALVDGAADEDEEGEEDGACDEDEGEDGERRPWIRWGQFGGWFFWML